MQTKDYTENIVDVKKIVEEKKKELRKRIEKLKKKNIVPKLAVILANDLDSSRIYVNNKRKLCKELKVKVMLKKLNIYWIMILKQKKY